MKVGLALGGGGAKGIAHIEVFKVLEELNIVPYQITGTSVGALMGVMFASGMSSEEIRQEFDQLFGAKVNTPLDLFTKKNAFKWLSLLDVDLRTGSLVKGEKVLEYLSKRIAKEAFEDLPISLKMVATDFWTGEQEVFEKGELMAPLNASICIPGVFAPVQIAGKTLVDGGLCNPVPYDLLNDCDIIIAVDVLGEMKPDKEGDTPKGAEAVFGAFDLMQRSILSEKMKQNSPDIYLRMPIHGIELFDFHKLEEISVMAQGESERLKQVLSAMITTKEKATRSWRAKFKQLFTG